MRRLVTLVSAIVLVESTFFSVLAPLLPHYEEEFGLTPSALGVLSGVYAAGALAGAIPSGLLAVRLGVKPTVLAGLAIIVGTSVAFGFAETAWVLYAARFGQGVGSALAWTGGLAWLIAASPRERRGELIGIAMGAAVAGALLGPVLGGAASLTSPAAAFSVVKGASIVRVHEVQPTVRVVRMTEAILGRRPPAVFATITLPLTLPGIGAGAALVFLACMKELPATLLLRPTGMDTLATKLWSHTAVAEYAAAAPYAALLVGLAAAPTWMLAVRTGALNSGRLT